MCKDNDKRIWIPPPIVDEPFAEAYDDPRVVVEEEDEEPLKVMA